jgi:hypothetical protein
MSDGFKFSEAARLYVRYMAVVDEMKQLFENDIAAFLDAVRERMQGKLEVGTIGQEDTKEYRSWWIEDEDTETDDFVPHVWLERKDEGIIAPGVLTVIADMTEATETEKRELSACKSSLSLPPHCKVFDRRLFGVTITYGDGDPVEAVAEPVLSVLTELHRVEKTIFAARARLRRPSKARRS